MVGGVLASDSIAGADSIAGMVASDSGVESLDSSEDISEDSTDMLDVLCQMPADASADGNECATEWLRDVLVEAVPCGIDACADERCCEAADAARASGAEDCSVEWLCEAVSKVPDRLCEVVAVVEERWGDATPVAVSVLLLCAVRDDEACASASALARSMAGWPRMALYCSSAASAIAARASANLAALSVGAALEAASSVCIACACLASAVTIDEMRSAWLGAVASVAAEAALLGGSEWLSLTDSLLARGLRCLTLLITLVLPSAELWAYGRVLVASASAPRRDLPLADSLSSSIHMWIWR